VGHVRPERKIKGRTTISGDVILEFNGKPVATPANLRLEAPAPAPARGLAENLRDGSQKTLHRQIGRAARLGQIPSSRGRSAGQCEALQGVAAPIWTPTRAVNSTSPTASKAPLSTGVEQGTPPRSRLKRGDVITEINRNPVRQR